MALHRRKHSRKEYYILSRIVFHVLSEGPALPKRLILFHLRLDLVLFCVLHWEILLKKIIERDVVVLIAYLFEAAKYRLRDDTMCYLRIEDEIRDYAELVNERIIIFAEVMENFENRFGLEYFCKAEWERV